ncbi:MAG: metallophosphoesterase family protein [bacterium]
MPSIAVLSDVHGNSPALQAVLDDIRERGIGTTYCLGDLVGYGPDPNGVIDLIRAAGVPTIMGNYDDGVGWERGDCGCFYADSEAKRVGEASYAFTVREVTADRKAFLRSLPAERHVALGRESLHLIHGSPRKINEYLLRDREVKTFLRLAEAEEDDVLVFGHTHVPWQATFGRVLFVNVGSVGRPKDGDARSMYAVLRSEPGGSMEVETVRVFYDVEGTAQGIIAAGLPAELAEAIRRGM